MIVAALIAQTPQAALSPKDFQAKCAEFSKAKDWPGLEVLARNQVAADSKDASAEAALGFALFAQKKSDQAKASCEAALKLDPKQMQALFYLGLGAAQEGDQKGVLAIAKRIEAIKPLIAVQFMRIPEIQRGAVPGTDLPLIEQSQVHFKAESMSALMDYISDAAGPRLAVAVIALTVGPDGVPTMAEALVTTPGLLVAQVEKAAIECRVAPIQVSGKPVPFRFIFDVTVNQHGGGGNRGSESASIASADEPAPPRMALPLGSGAMEGLVDSGKVIITP